MSKELQNQFVTQHGLTSTKATLTSDKLDIIELDIDDSRLRNGYMGVGFLIDEARWDGDQQYEMVIGYHDDGDTSTAYVSIYKFNIRKQMLGAATSQTADYKGGFAGLQFWWPKDEIAAIGATAKKFYVGLDVTGSNTTAAITAFLFSTGI